MFAALGVYGLAWLGTLIGCIVAWMRALRITPEEQERANYRSLSWPSESKSNCSSRHQISAG
jgi:hypothetical protein